MSNLHVNSLYELQRMLFKNKQVYEDLDFLTGRVFLLISVIKTSFLNENALG